MIRKIYDLFDSIDTPRETYDRAVNAWGFEVVGGSLASAVGSLIYFGVEVGQGVHEVSAQVHNGAGVIALAGLATAFHGLGRLNEMGQQNATAQRLTAPALQR
ncbi:hypothetical protein KDA23_02010 [Candidatus Saccharibacteria bacterium]|nr:hypothetical protein [Candidatus Saccharibacteria bacterium]